MSDTAHHTPETLDGWFSLHDFRSLDWASWKMVPVREQQDILAELFELNDTFRNEENAGVGGFGQFSIVGHKADLMFLHFRESVKELVDIKNRFNRTRFADFTTAPYSYFSVVELGAYLRRPGTEPLSDPDLKARLQPRVPTMEHVCFYPMNKKREGNDNWYTLSPEARRAYLMAHGMIGRTYAGRVKQIITGSMGLDDWEWGVTLFADHPLEFKKLVYEMRFDEGSARFGEFGPFLVGHHTADAALLQTLVKE